MSRVIVLDTGVLGLLAHPQPAKSAESRLCSDWFTASVAEGAIYVLPEIVDYELRREALRTREMRVIQRLDHFKEVTHYAPITTAAMLRAAELWAWIRNQGRPLADPKALDADVILAGQVAQLADLADDIIIATTNQRHLALFGDARRWQDIPTITEIS